VEVYRLLRQKHDIVGVFTVPDVNGRPDPLGMHIMPLCSHAHTDTYKPLYWVRVLAWERSRWCKGSKCPFRQQSGGGCRKDDTSG